MRRKGKQMSKMPRTTEDAIRILKNLPGFTSYHRYFENKLAGDFAFELAKYLVAKETKLADARAEIEKATTTEAERWAERLNWLHTKHGADCSGTDSADLLDCVEDEIKQVINKQSELIEQMRGALNWYKEQVSNCNRNGDIGETARDQLAKDVGKRAKAALSAAEEGGNKV